MVSSVLERSKAKLCRDTAKRNRECDFSSAIKAICDAPAQIALRKRSYQASFSQQPPIFEILLQGSDSFSLCPYSTLSRFKNHSCDLLSDLYFLLLCFPPTAVMMKVNPNLFQVRRLLLSYTAPETKHFSEVCLMKSCEDLVAPVSDYFIYSPSRMALEMFLYPLQCGLFSYLPGYSLTRESFDSFLLMYIQKGELELSCEGRNFHASAGQFILIDCYKRHAYSTRTGWECLWCHFDGITARSYYKNIISRLGNVFSLTDSFPVLRKMTDILKIFYNGSVVREPLLSKYLTDILTEFLLFSPEGSTSSGYADMAERIITYINENFAQDVSIPELAEQAGLSQYHFIRTFKKETGFTPHEYLVNTRLATARYLLKNTRLPVKDICFNTGFSCESVFCSAFKKHQGMTPAQYRALEQ